MLDLPQELTDKVIDYLYDDKPSLAACSRVCWAWVPATRVHIFSDITLRRKWNRLFHPQFRPFIDMLATESCTFAPFVARLTLAELDQTPAEGQEFAPAFSLLGKLTAVTSLTFMRWRDLGAQPVPDLLHATSLSEITFSHLALSSADQLFSMLELCPQLTSLAIVLVSWGSSPSSPTVYSHASSIRRLRLVGCPRDSFLDIFSPPDSPLKLSCNTVEIRGITLEDIPSIGRFLTCVAGCLQHLTISFTFSFDDESLHAESKFESRMFC